MRWSGVDLANVTGGQLHGDDPGPGVILTDTRLELTGAWFLAIVGERFDGHAFAARAQQAGAHGGIFARQPEGWTGPWVQVDDTFAALYAIAAASRARLTGPVVGISGCAGKTTTRELVSCALAPLGAVHRTRANDNNHLGVPFTLLAASEEAAAVVIELGSSGPGEMGPLADLTSPDVRLCLNIGPAHLEALGTLEAVRREEGALVDRAGPEDVVVVNADDPWLRDVSAPGRVLRFGRAEEADVRLLDAIVDVAGWSTTARYATPEGEVTARIGVPGAHLAHNGAAALAVACAVGVPLQAAADALSAYAPVGRRVRREVVGGLVVVDDAYNANPMSVRAALDLVSEADGPVCVVLGDMLELGAEEHTLHVQTLQDAVERGLDAVVAMGPRMAGAASEVDGVVVAGDVAQAAAQVLAALPAGGLVLLKGSRGMRMERVLDALREAVAPGGSP